VTPAPAGRVVGPVAGWALVALLAAGTTTWLVPTARGAVRPGHGRLADPGGLADLDRLTDLGGFTGTLVQLPAVGALLLLGSLVGAGAIAVLAIRGRSRDHLGVWVGVVAVSVVAAASVGGVLLRTDAAGFGRLAALSASGGVAEVEVAVVAEPRPIASGWQVLGRVERIDGVAVRERVAWTLPSDPPALGERISALVSARPLPDDGYGRWLAQQHARVVLDVHRSSPLAEAGPAARGTEWLRERVRTAATRHLDDRVAGLLVGLVIGDTRLLPAEDREAMRATALGHLTAVSGTHVAIVLAGVVGLAGLLRLPVGPRRLMIAVIVPWFAFLTRFQPSVLRAGAMALLLLLASTRGHVRDPRHALAAVVLALVLLDPLLAGSVGLLLSATATAGVLVLAPILVERFRGRLPRRVTELVAVTVGAQLAVLPVLLLAFGSVRLASVPANLIAVPVAIVAAGLAFLGTALAVVSVELAAAGFLVAGLPAWVVLWVAQRFSTLGGTVEVVRPSTVVAALAVGTLVLLGRRARARPIVAVLAAVAVVVAAWPTVVGPSPPQGLRLTAIDVGQGDAFLVESPEARILVDAGEDDTALRWLQRTGRRHIDLVVVSHPHLDHVGGVPAILGALDVGVVWAAPIPTELPAAVDVRHAAAAAGVPIRAPVRGETVTLGDLEISVLHPPPGRPYRHADSELNESSYVLRVRLGDRRVLLAGEVEDSGQAALLASSPELLAAEVLAVPHHGSATTSRALLAAVAPRIAVISVGADNRYGHPHADVIDWLTRARAEVRRTDREGTVTVDVPPARPG